MTARGLRWLCVVLCVAGCAPTVIPASHDHFAGLTSIASGSPQKPLRILLVHGMGTTTEDAFDQLMSEIAAKLGLTQRRPAVLESTSSTSGTLMRPNPIPIPIPGVPANAQALLYSYDFGKSPDGPSRLSVSFLLWSPLTSAIKGADLAETGAPARQAFSNFAKEFIQDKLGDVVLYGGAYRERIMRPTVEAALCDFIGGAPSPDGMSCSGGDDQTPTAIITHSLGGYMVMDAIDEELTRNAGAQILNEETAAAKVLRSMQLIYMLANQLALLDMTTIASYPSPEPQSESVKPGQQAPQIPTGRRLLDRFSSEWASIKRSPYRAPFVGRSASLQIVAFSDPNDILSYLVRHDDLGLPSDDADSGNRYFTNVYMPNEEIEVPFLFSDPFGAHTGYLTNKAVIDLLVCGMTGGATNKAC